MKKIFWGAVLLAAVLLCGCEKEQSIDVITGTKRTEVSEVQNAEETVTVSTVEPSQTTAVGFEGELSDYDRAVKLAAEYIDEHGAEHLKYILYDFDLDGIPELLEETGFKDTKGWEIYKLTGSEAADMGYMEFAGTDELYIRENIDMRYYHGDELTLESGVHICRDTEKDEIFYVTEYVTELHTTGSAKAIRYDVYADKLAEKELYHCDFLTLDDCGESGYRYITHNILDGGKASPMYRQDCNADGFVYCNEFGDYLSNFEYLGMIEVENYYSKKNGGSFYDYAETVKIPEKTREERIYTDDRERLTVCGEEYYADAYEVEVIIDNDNFDSVDLSELKLLPCLEKLTLWNRSDKIVDISEIADIEGLTEVIFYGGDFDYSPVVGMDNVIYTNAPDEYALKMKSVRVLDTMPPTDDIDGYAPLYDLEQLEVVMYSHRPGIDEQIKRLEERRPDLMTIYVP